MKVQFWMILLLALVTGCDNSPPDPYAGYGSNSDNGDSAYGDYGSYYGASEITFLDEASSNASLDDGLPGISFIESSGEERKIGDLAPGKTLVVVVTRGNTVPICPYCSTQTARLIKNYDAFKELGAEVAVVYPIETGDDSSRLTNFLEDVKTRLDDASNPVPFPVLLDVELKGVDQLGIRKDLSKPAAYVVDAEGAVRYAYVGENLADRPGISVLLAEAGKYKPAASSEVRQTTLEEEPVVDPEPETTSSEEPAAE